MHHGKLHYGDLHMAKLNEKQLENIKKVYLAARENLLDTIINYQGVGTKTYYNTVLKQLNAEIERLNAETNVYIDTEIPKEYKTGLDEVYSYYKKNNLKMNEPNLFASIHTDAVYALSREMQFQIQQGIAQAGRQVLRYLDESRDNTLRIVGIEATAEKIASGSTVMDMKNNLIEKLQNEGFMTVQYGSGKDAYQVSLDSYATMVARSTTREAGNLARENQLVDSGYDLVKMSTHYPTCNVCAKYQGRVYSISGKDERFPPLSKVFASGYKNIHPNCRHVIVPWIESLQTDEEIAQAILDSSKPLKDSRDQKQIDLYNKQQKQNRQMRQNLYQYERYKQRLGQDAPKSFSAFRRVKKADDELWNKMQLDYKRRNKLTNNSDLVLPDAENAFIESAKFTNYFFGGDNKNGTSKGVAFNSRLGYNISNWKDFKKEILEKAIMNPAKHTRTTEHGQYYDQPMVVYGKKNKPMDILAVWELKDNKPRLVTAYPNKEG